MSVDRWSRRGGRREEKEGTRDTDACGEGETDERDMKGEWRRRLSRKKKKSKSEAARGAWDGCFFFVFFFPAPPLSMNRRYVPKSVLPVTSWLLNNGTALGAT